MRYHPGVSPGPRTRRPCPSQTPREVDVVEGEQVPEKYCRKQEAPSWALLAFDNISLALVRPQQHPPHVAFVTDTVDAFGDPVKHRDGTASVYIEDSEGNTVEMLSVPECA